MGYATLKNGAKGEEVRALKRLLNGAGYAVNDDDVFDDATDDAVKRYQSDHLLTADGEVGASTWAKLASNPARALPDGASTREKTDYLESSRPAGYVSAYDEQVRRLTDQILGRERFSYDPAEDELYKRQRDEYAYLGRRAMNDARGAAAGLSGGYDNSFAEAAGQQAYQNSLAQLTDSLPELYQLALSTYQTEGDRLSGALKTLTDADDTAYRRYRDDVSDYEAALKYYYQKLKDEQNQENWEFKNKPRASGSRGPSREKQPDGDLARLVTLAVTGAKREAKRSVFPPAGRAAPERLQPGKAARRRSRPAHRPRRRRCEKGRREEAAFLRREERFLSGSSREKQSDNNDLARLVALAVTGAKKGGEKKRLSSGGKSSS